MTIKHDQCQEWEVEITRLRLHVRRLQKVVNILCDSNIELVQHLKFLDPTLEIDVLIKNLDGLKEKYSND